MQIDDDFNDPSGSTWQKMTLAHDHNGNLTDDGVFLYVYDAWNRLRKVTRRVESTVSSSLVAEYKYDGLFRRIEKDVTNSGYGVVHKSDDLDGDGTPDATGIQAGDRTEHYYYAGWSIVEERNGSNQVTAQTVWGTQYIDEPVCRDRNTNVGTDDVCVDSTSARYTYHQDANFRVVALTNESGAVVERYDYTAYGEPTILGGVDVPSAGSESGAVLRVSKVGNPFMHQGLFRDDESGTYQNRFRQLHSRTGRFMQTDPLAYLCGMNQYLSAMGAPLALVDSLGLTPDWLNNALSTAGNIGMGIAQGIHDTIQGTVTGAYNLVGGVVNDIAGEGTMYSDPAGSAQAIASSIAQTYDNFQQDGSSVASAVTQTAAAVAAGVVGGNQMIDAATGVDAEGNQLSTQQRVARGTEAGIIVGSLVAASGAKLRKVNEGVYEVRLPDGRVYVGRSIDITRRLKQHVRAGKITAEAARKAKRHHAKGLAKQRALEQKHINKHGGPNSNKCGNKRNEIRPKPKGAFLWQSQFPRRTFANERDFIFELPVSDLRCLSRRAA